VEYGSLKLAKLGLSRNYGFRSIKTLRARSGKAAASLRTEKDLAVVYLDESVELKPGDRIEIVFNR